MKVIANDLFHEAGNTYKKDEAFETNDARGKRLIEIGICRPAQEEKDAKEAPPAPNDKMQRGKKG